MNVRTIAAGDRKIHLRILECHPCLKALDQAIVRLKDRINRYRRHPTRVEVSDLQRASETVSNVLRFVVGVYDGHLSRSLLKRAVGALADAAKVLEKRRPIRRELRIRWFVKKCEIIAGYFHEFEVLLGDGRAAYRQMLADIAMGQSPRAELMH